MVFLLMDKEKNSPLLLPSFSVKIGGGSELAVLSVADNDELNNPDKIKTATSRLWANLINGLFLISSMLSG